MAAVLNVSSVERREELNDGAYRTGAVGEYNTALAQCSMVLMQLRVVVVISGYEYR